MFRDFFITKLLRFECVRVIFCRKVLSLEEFASHFENIDPVSQYKKWTTTEVSGTGTTSQSLPRYNVFSDRVKAAFVISDPVDWGRDIQVVLYFEFLCV